jgi:hypothetical protein
VTIGLLVLALMTVRMMARFFSRAAEDLSQLTLAVRESVDEIHLVAQEARALVSSLRDCVPPVQRVVDRFEAVGQRTADLSSTLLEELEVPVFTAAAVARSVRSGANHFLGRMIQRFTHRRTHFNGGYENE